MPDHSQSFSRTFHLRADHPHLAGHFPGMPIFPAVGQIEWVVALVAEHLGRPVQLLQVKRAKFKAIMRPNVSVQLDITTEAGEVHWVLKDAERTYSQGHIAVRADAGAAI